MNYYPSSVLATSQSGPDAKALSFRVLWNCPVATGPIWHWEVYFKASADWAANEEGSVSELQFSNTPSALPAAWRWENLRLTLFLALMSTPLLMSSSILAVSLRFAASWNSFSEWSTAAETEELALKQSRHGAACPNKPPLQLASPSGFREGRLQKYSPRKKLSPINASMPAGFVFSHCLPFPEHPCATSVLLLFYQILF